MINLSTQRHALYALLAAALFGVSAPLAKWLGTSMSPVMLAALLYLGSGGALAVLWLVQRHVPQAKRDTTPLHRADWPWLLAAVLLGGALAPVLLVWGLSKTSGATASLLLSFEGILTALLAAAVFGEAVDRRVWVAAGLMLLASAALVGVDADWHASMGMLAILGACFCWAMDNNVTRPISGADPVLIAMLKGLGAGVMNLTLALSLGQPLPRWDQVIMALSIGAFSYGISLVLFILALRHLGSARAGAHFGTAPFFGAAFAVFWLQEPLTNALILALGLMALASWLVLSERHGHEHLHEHLAHEHLHEHDEHHQHAHAEPADLTRPHSHRHVHEPLLHTHEHLPDVHHRHAHE
jgi:drug/metabolite transporter (DMT)-like permease